MVEKLDVKVTDNTADGLPPLNISPEMESELQGMAGPSPEQQTDEPIPEPVTVTPEQIASFLKLSYQAEGMISRYPDLWERDDAWHTRIAEGITPQINQLCQTVPMVGHAIKAVDAAGCWAQLIWDQAYSWYLVWGRNQAKKADAQREVQNDGANGADGTADYRIDYATGTKGN